MKAIIFVCGVICIGVGLFWSFLEFNAWLKVYAPTLALLGSVVALASYRNSIRVAGFNARRAAVELAVRECRAFGTEILPQLTSVKDCLEKAGATMDHFRPIDNGERLEPNKSRISEHDRSAINSNRPAIEKVRNAVESFAIPFCQDVAATDVGFRECGRGFVSTFNEYFLLFSYSELAWYYPSTQELYWRWRRELELRNEWHSLVTSSTWRQRWHSIKATYLALRRYMDERGNRMVRRVYALPVSDQISKD